MPKTAIVTLNLLSQNVKKDIEVPLDISAGELCSALFDTYCKGKNIDSNRRFLRSERPIALMRGDRTLREYGVRNGTVINITE
jgi:hypothetical protein